MAGWNFIVSLDFGIVLNFEWCSQKQPHQVLSETTLSLTL